jgi:ribosomal protein S12 methylthiotransferase
VCSFCAIPSIRGKHRSKSLEDVVSEAQELVGGGVRELVIVAEDSTAWGRENGRELPDVVEAIAQVPGLARVRVMYAYPNKFPWRLTEVIRAHPAAVPYLDIPIQHIATNVLRAMKRHGSGDQVRKILDRLREEVPGITLRTTVLLGFPGETDADAAELARFVEEYELGRVGTFTYSPEQGTSAWGLANEVPANVARERELAVQAARDRVLRKTQKARVGTEVDVLIDEVHERGKVLVGRPASDAPEVDLVAVVRGSKAGVGDVVRAKVEAIDGESNLVCRAQRAAADRAVRP